MSTYSGSFFNQTITEKPENSWDKQQQLCSFEVWCNLSVKPLLSREQALNQLWWNNQFLRIGGQPIFNKTLFSKGLISLANILTNTGSLKPWNFFKADRLNFNDYSFLFGLFNSIPLAWRKLINSKDETSADTSA